MEVRSQLRPHFLPAFPCLPSQPVSRNHSPRNNLNKKSHTISSSKMLSLFQKWLSPGDVGANSHCYSERAWSHTCVPVLIRQSCNLTLKHSKVLVTCTVQLWYPRMNTSLVKSGAIKVLTDQKSVSGCTFHSSEVTQEVRKSSRKAFGAWKFWS